VTDQPLLSISGLEVAFGGFRALQGVDFEACAGEIHFLIGPNGAGKTTLVDVVTGLTKPSEGSVRFGATELVGRREHEIVRLGVGRTFQTATVFEQLTVTENLDLARSFRMRLPRLLRRRHGTGLEVAKALDTIGLGARGDALAGGLSHGEKQWLEIGMLLVQDPRLLLLDEPVAGMSPEERTRTGNLIREVARDRTVLVVEHDMDFLRRFATRVTVMHEGRILRHGVSPADVRADAEVQEIYVGRARDSRGRVEAGV
jgi:urea transport system ATP-binding protein